HLLAQGYQRIAYLGNSRAGLANTERLRGFQETMRGAGVAPEVIVHGPNGRLAGGTNGADLLLATARRIWGALPDAIMCYNDLTAIGALHVLHGHGLRVPADVAVTGFDDIDISAYVQPPLTTWHQPRYELGVEAMRMLLALLDRKRSAKPPRIVTLNGSLVVRGSSLSHRTTPSSETQALQNE
ncbi:MAG: substrate-binding domain-containing protein, partial [Caldilineaceae bacterium]|nr:substrate-binding domain-containing protein [Caldilineaceae bacterium]